VVPAFNPGFVAAPICMSIAPRRLFGASASVVADVDGGTPMGCDFKFSDRHRYLYCSDLGPNDVTLTVTDISFVI
jgi:hypothetical protein